MNRIITYCMLLLLAGMFANCDIKRNDKLADDSLIKDEKRKQQHDEAVKKALADSTTVQLIDSAYDFGTVKDGDLVTHSYTFKNTGNKPLVVMTAQASCGCTVPEKPEEPIAPGGTGTIKVVFHSKDRSGRQEKTIRVTSNARPEFGVLSLTGTVEK